MRQSDESVGASPLPTGATVAAMGNGSVSDAVGQPEDGGKAIEGISKATAAVSLPPESATGAREALTEAGAAAAQPSEGGSKERHGIFELCGDDRPVAEGTVAEVEDGRGGTVGGVAAHLSNDDSEGKDRILEPCEGDRLMVEGAIAVEDEMDGRVVGEQGCMTEGTVAGENEIGPSDAVCVVTVAVAGHACEKGSDKKVEDGASTAATTSKKQRIPRTSCYHGVTRHRWTGKYEAHLWDRTINIESRKRKGKQVYLGGYDTEEKAARAYDLAALKYWGVNAGTKLNFPITEYERELVEMENMNRDEWVASLRRRSTCFSRGVSVYRGVARRKDGKWQARVGSVASSRDIYLGAFSTEEEAAIAYDIAVVELRGPTAITNFDINNYLDDDFRRIEATPSLKR